MAQKKNPRTPPPEAPAMPQSLRESAQHIWMAGLSAFAKAQSGGNKVFEALMKEGEAIQSRTRQAARDQVDDMAEKASGTWDKLEQVFETRVAKALHTLGVPTHDDIETLSRRVAELTALVDGLQHNPAAQAKSGTRQAGEPRVVKARVVTQRAAAKTAPTTKSTTTKSTTKKTAAKKAASKQAVVKKAVTRQPVSQKVASPSVKPPASRRSKTQLSTARKAAD